MFVQHVYSTLLHIQGYKSISVATKLKIKGTSGAFNEFDVYYQFTHLNLTCHVAIECKDWKNPVDISEVRNFAQKIDDVGNCRIIGAMVSKNGYQSGAKIYANSKGITLLKVDDLPSLPELLSDKIQKAFLPDESVIGEPFWTIMKTANGQLTGDYHSLQRGRPLIPLFYSKRTAQLVVERNHIEGCVRGVSQYHLKNLIAISEKFGDAQFALFCYPTIPQNVYESECICLNANQVKEDYCFE